MSIARPLVAIVGRPNVGKSTLFNRLCGGHRAIVENEPGVTRDRRYGDAEWDGRLFRVVDTGGLDPESAKPSDANLARAVLHQAMLAVEEAELIIFVCDARTGLTAEDEEAAELLRKRGKQTLWVANKVDRAELESAASELYKFGADSVFAVSSEHGRGTAELCDAIVEALPNAPHLRDLPEKESDETRAIRLALVGRPNAGKSSLLNRFLGEERVIVDARAGTTRDPVDTPTEIRGRKYVLIDTAGIRKRARIEAPMEKIAVAMAEKSIARADVCLLVIDAAAGLAEQEAKIAGICDKAGRALVICFNKLDLISASDQAKLVENFKRQLQFVPWATIVFASAKTGKGLQKVLDAVQHAYTAYTRRVTTGALNRWFETIAEKHPPSVYRGHPIKLYFIQQPEACPPTFLLSVNYPEGVHFSYHRFLANQLREAFDLNGTPVRIVCRARRQRQSTTHRNPPKSLTRR